MENQIIDYQKVTETNNVIKKVIHPSRVAIIEHIAKKKRTNVTEMYTELGLNQSDLSQHLMVLRKIGIINGDKIGREVYYTIDYTKVNQINELSKILTNETN
jgi:ArsR family transcriptional regulator